MASTSTTNVTRFCTRHSHTEWSVYIDRWDASCCNMNLNGSNLHLWVLPLHGIVYTFELIFENNSTFHLRAFGFNGKS